MPLTSVSGRRGAVHGLAAASLMMVAGITSGASEHEVTLFSIDHCPSCEAAKVHFEARDIGYHEFNIQESERAREAFERLGGRGTPLLFLNGETLNGFHPQRFEVFWEEATGTPVPEPTD